MSIICSTRVKLYADPSIRGNEYLVLLEYADRADHDGSNAYPSIDTVAKLARVSEATVYRCLKALKKKKAIKPTGVRPNGTIVYHVLPGVDEVTIKHLEVQPDEEHEGAPGSQSDTPSEEHRNQGKGIKDDGLRVSRVTPERPRTSKVKTDLASLDLVRPESNASEDKKPKAKGNSMPKGETMVKRGDEVLSLADAFTVFWAAYPRRDDRKGATKSFEKVVASDSEAFEAIMANLDERTRPGGVWHDQPKTYILLPTTYLNGQRWTDETTARQEGPNAPSREPAKRGASDDATRARWRTV